jgi:hypothetical protein
MSDQNVFPCDILVAMPTHTITAMFEDGIHMFPQLWLYFLLIPLHIECIWIYEDGEEGITTMLALD